MHKLSPTLPVGCILFVQICLLPLPAHTGCLCQYRLPQLAGWRRLPYLLIQAAVASATANRYNPYFTLSLPEVSISCLIVLLVTCCSSPGEVQPQADQV